MALRSARARGRAGVFFELVLALVARGMFFFRSNGFALRAGGAGLVFSLSWFSRRWRGVGFSLAVKWLALRAGAPVARGRFSFSVKWLALRAGQR